MEKKELEEYKYKKLVYTGTGARIYQIENDLLLKVMNPIILEIIKSVGISYDNKIFNTRASDIEEIIKPITAIYEGRKCIGYTMTKVNGINLNRYLRNFTLNERQNLEKYTELYNKIEKIIIKGNNKGIVFPDICTIKNIMIKKDNSISLIDYDGMQFGKKDKSICMSTLLGNPDNYENLSKYTERPFNYTKELDKKSLTILLFLCIFNIDLNKIGEINPITNQKINLENIFKLLNIEDIDFMEKVKANLSPTEKGYYLGDDLEKLSKEYKMKIEAKLDDQVYVKRLIKK